MITPENRTQYQDEIVQGSMNTIMIAARQSGKTETVAQCAADVFRANGTVICLAPQQRMVRYIHELLQDEFDQQRVQNDCIRGRSSAGEIRFRTQHGLDYDDLDTRNVDLIAIDEANYVSQELLFQIEKYFDGRLVLTATPAPSKTVVEIWAEHSPYWKMWHVPATQVPYIDTTSLDTFRDSQSDERELREVEAKIP